MTRFEVLKDIINTDKLETIAEVGVRDGETMYYLLENCPTIKKYYAVDNDENAKFLADSRISDERICSLIGDSSQIAKNFPYYKLDLVFIDADHKLESVERDIDSWLVRLRVGGYLTGHDYDNPAHRDVKTAVDRRFGGSVKSYQDGAYTFVVKQ